MLSTNTRLRVEFICDRIKNGASVELADMAWVQKWAQRNPTVATMLRQARRAATQPEPSELDEFCQALDIGDPDPSEHLVGPQNPVDLAEWFTRRQRWFRGEAN